MLTNRSAIECLSLSLAPESRKPAVIETLERRAYLSAGLVFGPEVSYLAGSRPSGVAAVDLNGDLAMDIVVSNIGTSGGSLSVFLNRGDGTFLNSVYYPTADGPSGVDSADVDLDGDADVVVSCFRANSIMVFKNNGSGGLTQKATYPAPNGARSVVTGDYDSDGDIDIALASSNLDRGSLSIYRNRGDGTFAARVQYDAGQEPFAIVAADFDRDGDLDIAASCWSDHKIQFMGNYGDGTFYKGTTTEVGGSFPRGLAASDWNRDGYVDLATGLQDGVAMIRNTGEGFTFEGRRTTTLAQGVAIGDLNGDSYPEVVATLIYDKMVAIMENLEGGFFEAPAIHDTTGHPLYPAIADLDGDGQAEIIATTDDGGVKVFHNETLTDSFPLTISGTDGDDQIDVSVSGEYVICTVNGTRSRRLLSSISDITIQAGDGDDSIIVRPSIATRIEGGDGNDSITGGPTADLIYGGDGSDTVYAGSGADTVYGNFGDDGIRGGSQNDSIMGGLGYDNIEGQLGDDRMWGGDQCDRIQGGGGSDYIEGKGKPDSLYGGDGNDTILGQAGNDLVYGQAGNDVIYVDDGESPVFADVVYAGLGTDSVSDDGMDQVHEKEIDLLA